MNNMPLQLEQTPQSSHIRNGIICHCNWNKHLCRHILENEQYAIATGTNTPVITHQKRNNMPLQLEQTPLSSHIRNGTICHWNWNKHLCHHISETEQYAIGTG